MNKNYVKPNMAKYGTCLTLIQGSCGWGIENITLDKTGYSKKKWRHKVTSTHPPYPCPGPDPTGKVNCGNNNKNPVCVTETSKVCSPKNNC